MRNLTKWALASLLVCSGVLAASQTDTVSQTVSKSVSQWVNTDKQPTPQVTQAMVRSEPLAELESQVAATQFDPANRMHALRLKRIMHYISQARQYDQQNWLYNRDDAVQRASNILHHHQMKTGQGRYVL